MSTELQNALEKLVEIAAFLDSKGYSLAIIKKPRQYNRVNIAGHSNFDENLPAAVYGNNNVRERRLAMGLTVRGLAEQMGVSNVIVYRMEKKGIMHKKISMQKFADFFGCSIDDLLTGDDANE